MESKNIIMGSKELDKGAIIKECLSGKYTNKEAGELLDVSDRQIRRLKGIVKKFGIMGLAHKLRGKPSNKKMPKDVEETIVDIILDKYWDFNPTHIWEKLAEQHNLFYSVETIRQIMITHEIWIPKSRKKNKEHRLWRERKDHKGEMVQYDGSYDDWFEGRLITNKLSCLLAGIDDAMGEITYAKFDTDEGVIPTMKFWMEYCILNGKPHLIYLDKHTTYKKNNLNQYKIFTKEEERTQFQLACDTLDIKVLNAHSPQAKGRIERLWGTLQNRLIKEMRLNNINTIEEANKFLMETFVPWFNKKYGVKPKEKTDFHRELTAAQIKKLPQIFCAKEKRVLSNDFTIQHNKIFYQLLKKQPCLLYRKAKITVEQHLNGEIKLSQKDKYLNFEILNARPAPKKKITMSEIKSKMRINASENKKSFYIPRNTKIFSKSPKH